MIEPWLDDFLNLCKWCDKQIVWATLIPLPKKAAPVRVCVDADPGMDRATLALSRGPGGVLLAGIVSHGQASGMTAAGKRVYVDHALTCQYASKWHVAADHGKASRRYGKR